ncbi:MAG TPA: hydrogenase maturation nickel metallochaperone HypA [Pseudomonadales bacterium]|nr:hydrogenase maturation nickel metallochaperone HypA [Pseudomonadales bacterium]
MHELSLCENILAILQTQAQQQGFAKVRRIWLEIGELACVEPAALRFSFTAVAEGSLAEGATLEIIPVAARARCTQCLQETSVQQRFTACPLCGELTLQLIGGDEMRVKEVEVE